MSTPVISFVIPSRNELNNLLWTLQYLFEFVQYEIDEFEVIVVLNMADPSDVERIKRTWWYQEESLRLFEYDQPSCWQSRNLGWKNSRGQYVCFLDSHVMFRKGSLRGAYDFHRSFKGILTFPLNYWLDKPERTLYQYKWQPHKFWGSWSREKPRPPDYRILMCGMNTLVDREVLEAIDGFHPALGIYGGGEPYYYLKTQMYGFEVRSHPEYQVYHLAEKRGYSWMQDDMWRNFMISAYALGGDEYLDPLYSTYQNICKGVERYLVRLDELRDEAVELASSEWARTQTDASSSLNQVINSWKAHNGIDP